MVVWQAGHRLAKIKWKWVCNCLSNCVLKQHWSTIRLILTASIQSQISKGKWIHFTLIPVCCLYNVKYTSAERIIFHLNDGETRIVLPLIFWSEDGFFTSSLNSSNTVKTGN